jgi:lactam utilization protein B
MNDLELIKHAAIVSDTCMIFLGKCHSDCFCQAFNVGIKVKSAAWAQGFFTNRGRFVSRTEAAEIAMASKQVEGEVKILFSEDLWSPTDGGKYLYNSIDGYYQAVGE